MKVKTFDSEDPKQNHFTFFTTLTIYKIFTIFNQKSKFSKITEKNETGEIFRDGAFRTLLRESEIFFIFFKNYMKFCVGGDTDEFLKLD